MNATDITTKIEEFHAAIAAADIRARHHNRYVNLTKAKAKRLGISYSSTEAREQWIAALQRLDSLSGDIFLMFAEYHVDASAVFDFIQRAGQIREWAGDDPLRAMPCHAAIYNLELHATRHAPVMPVPANNTRIMSDTEIGRAIGCSPRNVKEVLRNAMNPVGDHKKGSTVNLSHEDAQQHRAPLEKISPR